MRGASVTWVIGLALALGGLTGCEDEVAMTRGAAVPVAYPGPQSWDPVAVVLGYAQAQVGRPYCWGGTGPRCFDCSGLTQSAWARVGVRLPRSADAFAGVVPEVPLTQVRPGDVLWWPGHVALYAGNGWSIEALNARSGVVERRPPPPRRVFRPLATL